MLSVPLAAIVWIRFIHAECARVQEFLLLGLFVVVNTYYRANWDRASTLALVTLNTIGLVLMIWVYFRLWKQQKSYE